MKWEGEEEEEEVEEDTESNWIYGVVVQIREELVVASISRK